MQSYKHNKIEDVTPLVSTPISVIGLHSLFSMGFESPWISVSLCENLKNPKKERISFKKKKLLKLNKVYIISIIYYNTTNITQITIRDENSIVLIKL